VAFAGLPPAGEDAIDGSGASGSLERFRRRSRVGTLALGIWLALVGATAARRSRPGLSS
jgi:hypothetical protein